MLATPVLLRDASPEVDHAVSDIEDRKLREVDHRRRILKNRDCAV
jgi:hypothetical protein